MDPNTGQPIKILIVEDNPGDIRLIKEILKEKHLNNNIKVAKDGEIALKILFNKEKRYRPDLILLDLNLPKIDGRELLTKIKENEQLKCTPVVILTTSTAEEDIIETYKKHANSYITKPMDLDQFIEVVESIKNFWLSIVKLPQSDEYE